MNFDASPGEIVALVLMLLIPLLFYLDAPCPGRTLDPPQRWWSRLTGRNKDHEPE